MRAHVRAWAWSRTSTWGARGADPGSGLLQKISPVELDFFLWSPLLLLEACATSGPSELDAFAVELEVSSCCSPPHRRPSSLPGCEADLTATFRRQCAPFPGKFWQTGNFWPGVWRLSSRGCQALSDDGVPCCHRPDMRRWVLPAEKRLWHFLVSTQAGMWILAASLPGIRTLADWVFDRFIMENSIYRTRAISQSHYRRFPIECERWNPDVCIFL